MGLLDDAIKQHLELKRQHGATEDEVKRQEAEALGPARRDFAAQAPPAEVVEGEVEGEVDGEVVEDEAPVARQPATWLDEDEPAAPEPSVAEVVPPEPDPEPAPPARATSDTPTQGFDALSRDELEDDEEGEEDDDVLEETPDFLQDTPEHDRLWFEQKPPRDFDFDG